LANGRTEAVLRKARALKPEGAQYFPVIAKCTLERHELQKDTWIAAHAQDKIAYFIMDKLVIIEKQSSCRRQSQGKTGGPKEEPPDSHAEVVFDTF